MEKIEKYHHTYGNWMSVILNILLHKRMITARLKNGLTLMLTPFEAGRLANFLTNFQIEELNERYIRFRYAGRSLTFYGYQYGDLYGAFTEHLPLNVEQRSVLDVGASIGDTAIYFSIRANRVIAVEPYPFAFRFLKTNILANNITNVFAINAGVGAAAGETLLPDTRSTVGSTALDPAQRPQEGGGVNIPIYSLDDLIDKYGPFEILKMDCEGCEYDAVLNSNMITEFKEIQIEYHYGPSLLVNKLKQLDFDVRYTKPWRGHDPEKRNPDIRVGMIIAKRK